MIDPDLDKVRSRLVARRAELTEMADESRGSRESVALDQTRVGRLSRMDALQGEAMTIETECRRHVELRRIESALARVASGDYGYCVSCGEEIAARRLEFDPNTPTCIDCAGRG